MESPVVNIRGVAKAPVFLIISNEMLRAGLHANALYTDDSFVGAFTVEIWIRPETGYLQFEGGNEIECCQPHLSQARPALGFLICKNKILFTGKSAK